MAEMEQKLSSSWMKMTLIGMPKGPVEYFTSHGKMR